jgi:hypothetical protein
MCKRSLSILSSRPLGALSRTWTAARPGQALPNGILQASSGCSWPHLSPELAQRLLEIIVEITKAAE